MQYILRKVFICGFTAKGTVIYIYYRLYIFIWQKEMLLLFVQLKVLESPGKALKLEKKSWRVLEFESVFLVAIMWYQLQVV